MRLVSSSFMAGNPSTSRAKISAGRESSIRGIFWKTPTASTPPAHQAYAEWTGSSTGQPKPESRPWLCSISYPARTARFPASLDRRGLLFQIQGVKRHEHPPRSRERKTVGRYAGHLNGIPDIRSDVHSAIMISGNVPA